MSEVPSFEGRGKDNGLPWVPERYSLITIGNMMPGEIAHLPIPSHSEEIEEDNFPAVIIAPKSRNLKISRDFEFDAELASGRTKYSPSASIMRIFKSASQSGELIDGYVVDIRDTAPGDLDDRANVLEEFEDSADWTDVLGIVYRGANNATYYRASRGLYRDLIDDMKYLAAATDEFGAPE